MAHSLHVLSAQSILFLFELDVLCRHVEWSSSSRVYDPRDPLIEPRDSTRDSNKSRETDASDFRVELVRG